MLLSGLFGNESAEKTLLYIECYGQGYARKMADVYGVSLSQIQRQLERFEREGILVSQLVGKTRLYQINPRYFFKDELRLLLAKALKNLPSNLKDKYFSERTRPRRKGKPL
jgi:DNA-binding transcriptional ArsR family regulator